MTEFSNGFWGSRVLTAYSNLGKITDERWAEVLQACGDKPRPSEPEMADLSLLDNDRGAMFDFSSPVKP